jgi:hypothetical protein
VAVSTLARKEYPIDARIKAIYMLEDKKSLGQIKDATGAPGTAIYRLHGVVRELGWRENKNMVLETEYVLNAPRFGRPLISNDAIRCVLMVVLQNSTIRTFSCAIIEKMIWKVLTQAVYSQCKLTVKPGPNKENKKER